MKQGDGWEKYITPEILTDSELRLRIERMYELLDYEVFGLLVQCGLGDILNELIEARQAAGYDYLTGLPNRRTMMDFLKHEMAILAREKPENNGDSRGIAVVTFDLDNFKKKINDEYGHPAGDEVLKLVASCMRNNLRESDMPVRLGGDEFCIVMPTKNYQELRGAFFGDNTDQWYMGATVDSILYRLNRAILQGVQELRQRIGVEWQPVWFNQFPTYLSAGMGFVGQGVLYRANHNSIENVHIPKLLKSSDEEAKTAKRLRRSGR